MKLLAHPVFPSMITVGHRAIAATSPVPHDPSTPAPIGDQAGTPDEAAIQTALVIVAKGTFSVDDASATPAADQMPVLSADETQPPLEDGPGDPDDPHDPVVRAESDLAVFKPRADVVVRGAPAAPEPPEPGATLTDGTWEETVSVSGQSMSHVFPPAPVAPFITFGWEPRMVAPRLDHSGRYGPDPFVEFVQSGHRLPVEFSNLFFNGGDYRGGDRPVFTHPDPGSDVVVSTTADFDLPGGGTASASDSVILHLPASFPTATVRYRDALGRHLEDELAMVADTIVYDKADTTFTVTWRANFDFLSVPADRYEEILVSGGV